MPDQYLAMTADPSHEESFHVLTQVSNDVMHGLYMKCWECIVISYGRNSLAKSLLGSIVLADTANAPCLWQESISDSVEDAPMVSWYTAL